MKSLLYRLTLIAILFGVNVSVSAETVETKTATSVVEGFQSSLLSVMQEAEVLGYNGRYQRLRPAVTKSHNLPTIAKVALGRNWNKLSGVQQAQFLDLFSRLSIAIYAKQFDGYSGESFRTVSEEDLARGGKVVQTIFIDSGGKEIPFNYMMRRDEKEQWMIVNIIADGVSDLALKRSEYSSILRREGFDALIAKLGDKLNTYSSTNQ